MYYNIALTGYENTKGTIQSKEVSVNWLRVKALGDSGRVKYFEYHHVS